MSLLSFIKDAGEKLLHPVSSRENVQVQSAGQGQTEIQAKEAELQKAILEYIAAQQIPTQDLTVTYDSANATVTVSGRVADQQTREKILLCCGNVQGVAHVNDQLQVSQPTESASQWYTVQSGDTLSKIARQYYGDPNKYMLIFESNRPMLSDPDKIYPGQMLRIPSASSLH